MSAVPVPDPDAEPTMIRLPGSVPNLRARFEGCFFAGRCPRKLGPKCDQVQPPALEAPEGNHVIYCHIPLDELGPVHTIGLNMISLEDGTYRSSIRTNSSLSAGATRQREHVEPPSPQRNSVRRRAWLQVAGLASEVWLLAHSLYPHEPLVQKRSPQSGVRTPSTRADSAHQYRGGFGGQHDCQGASRWHGRVKKNGPQSIGKSRGGWTTKIHMVAADARTALMFSLSAGQAHDAPEGRKLLNRLGPQRENLSIVMDRAYEGNETRQLALALGFTPVVPPSSTRVSPWTYDMEMYKRRNEVERLFRRLKGFRRIFSRFEKLDVLFLGFILLTLIVDALR